MVVIRQISTHRTGAARRDVALSICPLRQRGIKCAGVPARSQGSRRSASRVSSLWLSAREKCDEVVHPVYIYGNGDAVSGLYSHSRLFHVNAPGLQVLFAGLEFQDGYTGTDGGAAVWNEAGIVEFNFGCQFHDNVADGCNGGAIRSDDS